MKLILELIKWGYPCEYIAKNAARLKNRKICHLSNWIDENVRAIAVKHAVSGADIPKNPCQQYRSHRYALPHVDLPPDSPTPPNAPVPNDPIFIVPIRRRPCVIKVKTQTVYSSLGRPTKLERSQRTKIRF